jgi:tetratricopeptide (TPR) repeat protein
MATTNSRKGGCLLSPPKPKWWLGSPILHLGSLSWILAGALWTGRGYADSPAPNASTTAVYAARAEQAYQESQRRLGSKPNQPEAAWRFARACFDRADYSRTDKERENLAQEGIAASQRALKLDPNLAAAHYYLALNLGQLARTRTLTALKIVREMERELERTIQLDASLDFAGPHRTLGMLYRDAPGWPASIGSRKNAQKHLEKAVEMFPHYPGNQLALLESLWQWGERKMVVNRLGETEAVLKSARKKLTGEAWASSWTEWESTWNKIKADAEKFSQAE